MLCEEVIYKKPCALVAQARFCEGFRQQCLFLLDLCKVALNTGSPIPDKKV